MKTSSFDLIISHFPSGAYVYLGTRQIDLLLLGNCINKWRCGKRIIVSPIFVVLKSGCNSIWKWLCSCRLPGR